MSYLVATLLLYMDEFEAFKCMANLLGRRYSTLSVVWTACYARTCTLHTLFVPRYVLHMHTVITDLFTLLWS